MPNEVINYSYDGELLTSAASSRPVSGSVGQAYDANFRPKPLREAIAAALASASSRHSEGKRG